MGIVDCKLLDEVIILERIFGSFENASAKIKPKTGSSSEFRENVNKLLNERKALIDLLSHPAGYGIQMAGWIDARVLESGEFAVCEYFDPDANQGMGNYNEQIFEKVEDAVDEFLKIRHRLEMGLDYDEKHWREAGLWRDDPKIRNEKEENDK